MHFTIESIECPAGIYRARFTGAEKTTHPEFGDGLRFEFEVTSGPHKGRRASRTTNANPTPRNAAGRMLCDLASVTPANGVAIDLDNYLNREFDIVVRENESGRCRVESVCAVKEGEPF